jgi:hypothetical protein
LQKNQQILFSFGKKTIFCEEYNDCPRFIRVDDQMQRAVGNDFASDGARN